MGEDDLRSCVYWSQAEEPTQEASASVDQTALPWSSRVLGLADLSYLASQSKVSITGLVGPKKCGKTTFLATIYLLLQRGYLTGLCQLVRSQTIGGWENVAYYLRWKGSQPPSFPPHTTAREGRVPGLLHLGMRTPTGGIIDIVTTDAPGEWFRRWAVDRDAADSIGARWVAENANKFVLMVDCDVLSGATRGGAILSYQLIAERLASEAHGRPVHIVWSKADVEIPRETKARLCDRLASLFPDAPQTDISVKPTGNKHEVATQSFVQIFNWMMHHENVKRQEVDLTVRNSDPFLAFRTHA